jgi:hypothetical protein
MSAVTIQQMADRVAGLMEERLSIRGTGLAAKLRKGGRLLPRKVRLAAETLADRAEKAENPKLLTQISIEEVSAAYDTCVRHLSALQPGRRRANMLIGMAGSVAFSLLMVAGLAVAFLAFRGLL